MSVACDSGGLDDARALIEAADPSYPVLIDRDHRVASLYGMVNVPTAVWIDEEGRIVRNGETAFIDDRYRFMSGLESAPYLDAIRDWIRRGDESPFAAAPDASTSPGAKLHRSVRTGHVHFELARHLHEAGHRDAAIRHMKIAQSLIPDSWNFRRQAWKLHGDEAYGTSFLEEVQKLGGKPYYPPIVLPEGGSSGR